MQELIETARKLVRSALDEDVGKGDLTSLACLEPEKIRAVIVAKSEGVVSGLIPATMTFRAVDSATELRLLKKDGDVFSAGETIVELKGFNQPILIAERTGLNFLAHLSGIASLTRRFVEKIGGSARIIDTRKTTPGWRLLEKAAVVHGGGENHRIGLYDMVLIKDNHIAACGSVRAAVEKTKNFLHSYDFGLQFQVPPGKIEIEVEVTNEAELADAISAGANRLLLDNQSIESLRKLVARARNLDSAVKLEASGNITLDNVAEIAATGVDYISSGALTHSAPASDFSLRVKN